MESNSSSDIELVKASREEVLLNEFIDARLELLFSSKTVGAEARYKLRNLLKYYAKKPHPFRACVRDNMKRFGPGRTEAVCATLKDIMLGTTKWRNNRKGFVGSDINEQIPEIDQELLTIILSISDEDLESLVIEASELNG